MNKVIKISSSQGGSFTKTNNLVDFEFGDGVYDLSKSYVSLMCSVSETPTNPERGGLNLPKYCNCKKYES